MDSEKLKVLDHQKKTNFGSYQIAVGLLQAKYDNEDDPDFDNITFVG